MKIGNRRWEVKSKKNILLILCSLLLSSCFLFTISSFAVASTQNAGDILREFITENYPWAEVSVDDLILNDGIPDMKPEKIRIEKGLPGKTVFSLEFRGGRKVTASANVKAFDWVVLSRSALGKGYVLKDDDIYLSLMDVTKIPKGAIRNIAQAEGKALERSVFANMPLVGSMFSESQSVKRGHRVILLAESPSFGLSTLGELKENSRVGNYVRAVNLTSKKVVTGKLIDENTVKVEF